MSLTKERHKIVLDKFQDLLRSGKDYTVQHMYSEAAKEVTFEGVSIQQIINKHYNESITQEMIDYIKNLTCPRKEEIQSFSEKFKVCRRESILLIRYIRRRNE